MEVELQWDSYAIYWEDRAGESGPAESDMSESVKYLEAMLPVDDLKGASRAIAPDPKRAKMICGSRCSRETDDTKSGRRERQPAPNSCGQGEAKAERVQTGRRGLLLLPRLKM